MGKCMIKAMIILAVVLIALNLVACSFTVGVDWQGETQVEQKRFNKTQK